MKKLVFILSLFIIYGHSLAQDIIKPLAIGSSAPSFSLQGIDDKTWSLKDFDQSDILVVIFTCNHCPTAQAYEQRIINLVNDYKSQNVAFVAISPNDPLAIRLDELGYTDLNDDFKAMKIRAKERGFNFPYLYDGDEQRVSKQFGPTATPHVFIFNKSRKLVYQGRIDDSEKSEKITTRDTRNALDALLKGKSVPVESTKTFGCSIKWADKRASVTKAQQAWEQEIAEITPISLQNITDLMKNPSENYILLNMWATWCGPCVVELPELVDIHRMYRNRNFRLITISVDDMNNRERAHRFLQNRQASMTNYISESDNIYKLIEIVDPQWQGAIPYTVLIAPGGEIVYRHSGIIDETLEIKREIVNRLGRTY